MDSARPSRVVILTGDPISAKLAGPGIRAWNMAGELSGHAEVRLVSYRAADRRSEHFDVQLVLPGDAQAIRELESWMDVLVVQGAGLLAFPALAKSSKVLVGDLYVPMVLEHLELEKGLPPGDSEPLVAHTAWIVNSLIERCDFFLAASSRQRMFWIGHLAALGRLNPATYADDPGLERLIAVVPFGLPAEAPEHTRRALRGLHPSIGDDDEVVIWSGGVHDWLDPHTLIRGIAELATRRPQVRLFFLGTRNPNPDMPEMSAVASSRSLAQALGVLDRNVVFNDDWVDYDDRMNYLLEADIGVSTHPIHVETEFSFRTRMLDYLWAGLPILTTEGDHFADLVARETLGAVVPAGDPTAIAVALEGMLGDAAARGRMRANVRRVAEEYRWSTTLAPLVAFIRQPKIAADRRPGLAAEFGRPRPSSRMRRLREVVRQDGVAEAARKVLRIVRGSMERLTGRD